MNWSQYGNAVLAAFIGATLSDAAFARAFLLRKIRADRQALWRPWIADHPYVAFGVTRLWTLVTCAVFLFCCGFFGLSSLQPAILFALGCWLAVVLPAFGAARIALQVAPGTLLAWLFGWLAKLLVCAAGAYYFL